MSKNWYPIINYEECLECGACIEKCSNGVYNIDKTPTPHVLNPGGCIEGCTGCGSCAQPTLSRTLVTTDRRKAAPATMAVATQKALAAVAIAAIAVTTTVSSTKN